MKLYAIHYEAHLVDKKLRYVLVDPLWYYSKRYNKFIYLPAGFSSDGATCAPDLASLAWWVHDRICDTWVWSDGTPISVLQSSMVLHDILELENRPKRANAWGTATFLAQIIKRPLRKKAIKPSE